MRLAVRLSAALALGVVLALATMLVPVARWLGPLGSALLLPAGVVLFTCYLGKLLYDTLFYDHYRA